MKGIYKITLHLILSLMLCSGAYAQYKPSKERGDPKFRAKGQLEGNRIRTTIHNFGLTGRQGGGFPISVQTPYEWPKNTGKVYLAMEGLWVGGEVVDSSGNNLKIIDVFDFRQSRTGQTWNFEPLPGYYNEQRQEIASSVDKGTWPASWPDKMVDSTDPGWAGKWNGYFGKDVFNADQELFYRAMDNRYDRYNYFPDTTDKTRKGMGIVFDQRSMAWSQFVVEDVVYLLHSIKNDGTKDITKVAVAIWYADFVGGDGDSQDDWSEFDLVSDIAWSRDNDNRAQTFGSDPVGIIGISFLETPGNATDRIDNDGDGEANGPKVTEALLVGEDPENLIDDNGNGLVDENNTHIVLKNPQGVAYTFGVSYADRIDQNNNAEPGSPVVTSAMVNAASGDKWKRWPPSPETIQEGKVHLLMVEAEDEGKAFADFIDNGNSTGTLNIELNSPVVTQEMITAAAADQYGRYMVPNSNIILYAVGPEDLGKAYADGIDNDGDGAIDEGVDEGIDEMIDESRQNGIDEDGDWNVVTDDVGQDGVAGTFDKGEGDGLPTSGLNTGLPGEPNIDVVDVSETDQMGITNAQYVAAGEVNVSNQGDNDLWFRFMRPGRFYDPTIVRSGEYDLFVSSGFFPLKSGQTEPISLAVILANGPTQDPQGATRKREILKKRVWAQETYNNDYSFAKAPLLPTLKAITGDNRVTLYWDDVAESSEDQYLYGIAGILNDFEGYRIYRASDPAFEDVELITTGYGVSKFKLPIKIFDKIDEWQGFDSIGTEGVHYDLGSNSGLAHSWTDSSVKNGFTYYYAITSYDFGYPTGKILPSESPINVSFNPDGSVRLGQNVVKVTPEAPVAGYVGPTLGNLQLVQGSTTSQVGYEIIDPDSIQDGHVYYLTFKDTLKKAGPGGTDTLTTKSYTLFDSTDNQYVIFESTNLAFGVEQPILEGFKLSFVNESRVEIDRSVSGWNGNDTSIVPFQFTKMQQSDPRSPQGTQKPNDYEVQVFAENVYNTKAGTFEGMPWPSLPVNFKVFNRSSQQYIDFVFVETDLTGGPGRLSSNQELSDYILFREARAEGDTIFTWMFQIEQVNVGTTKRFPQAGDTAVINLRKPFLSQDVFRFVAKGPSVDPQKAKADMENIKVVPNPYVASAEWEPKNPYVSGRGPRAIHFTHLPKQCKIRIFTVSGELVKEIDHDSPYNDGTAEWNLLSSDNLAVSYGVYVFHVDAPGIGSKIGKFAIIK